MRKILLLAFIIIPRFLFAQWQECTAPYQGTILQLATFDGYIWAGTENGGIYRTSNQQSNWEIQNDGLSAGFDMQVYSLKVINGELYLGSRGGLFKKSSANSNWVQLANYFYPASDVCGGGNNVLIYGMYGAVRRSTDGGITWQDSNIGLPTGGNFDIRVTENNSTTGEIMINLGGIGLYRSTNQGASWSPINYPGGLSPSTSFITMLKMVNNVMYAGVEPQGLYSWNPSTGDWQFVVQSSGRITDLIIVNNKYLSTTSYGIQMFPISGSGMFNTVIGNSPSYLPGSYALEQSGNQIYIGAMNECAYIIDTALQTYSTKKTGMKSSSTEWISGDGTFLFTQANKQHFLHASNDEFTTTSTMFDTDPYYMTDNVVDVNLSPSKWYFVRSSRGISLSYDHGQTMIKANYGLPASTFQTYNNSSICKSNAGYMITGTRDGKFYKSINDTSWTLLCDLFSSTEYIDRIINAGNYLFASTQNVMLPSSAHVYRSSDNGQSWQILPGPFYNGLSVYGITYDGTRLIAGASGYGTWSSNDYGQTWTTINNGLPQYNVFKTIKSFNGVAYGVSLLNKRLYRLLQGDTTWTCVNCNAGDPLSNEVFFQNGTLFIGTPGNGIYKWVNYTTGVIENEKPNFDLFPNPSKRCIINFTNTNALPIVLKIFSVDGGVVYSNVITTENTSINLNGELYSPGLYVVQTTDKEGRTTAKKWKIN